MNTIHKKNFSQKIFKERKKIFWEQVAGQQSKLNESYNHQMKNEYGDTRVCGIQFNFRFNSIRKHIDG